MVIDIEPSISSSFTGTILTVKGVTHVCAIYILYTYIDIRESVDSLYVGMTWTRLSLVVASYPALIW